MAWTSENYRVKSEDETLWSPSPFRNGLRNQVKNPIKITTIVDFAGFYVTDTWIPSILEIFSKKLLESICKSKKMRYSIVVVRKDGN